MKAKRHILGAALSAAMAFPWLAVANDLTPEELNQRSLERRAVEAVPTGCPPIRSAAST